jgi:hypothetical protein
MLLNARSPDAYAPKPWLTDSSYDTARHNPPSLAHLQLLFPIDLLLLCSLGINASSERILESQSNEVDN